MYGAWVKYNEWLENYVEIKFSVNQYEQELGLTSNFNRRQLFRQYGVG